MSDWMIVVGLVVVYMVVRARIDAVKRRSERDEIRGQVLGNPFIPENQLRNNLRASLDAVVNKEKQDLGARRAEMEANTRRGVEMMRPLLAALEALKKEVKNEPGITISIASPGHMGTVNLNTRGLSRRLSVSTNLDKSKFEIELFSSYSEPESQVIEQTFLFPDAESALARIVQEVGEHIARKSL